MGTQLSLKEDRWDLLLTDGPSLVMLHIHISDSIATDSWMSN